MAVSRAPASATPEVAEDVSVTVVIEVDVVSSDVVVVSALVVDPVPVVSVPLYANEEVGLSAVVSAVDVDEQPRSSTQGGEVGTGKTESEVAE